MPRPGSRAANLPEPSRLPSEGWHCSHLYYSFCRSTLASFSESQITAGREAFQRDVCGDCDGAPTRFQSFIVAGHKADFGLMMLAPDPLKIDAVHQKLLAGPLGPAILPEYSFVSMTEISEYVPTLEQFCQKLTDQGLEEGSEEFEKRKKGYADREPMMRRARLTPDMPAWPAMCFYPMNKRREVGANWFTQPFAERDRMMLEHGESGMQFAGRVTQLVTVGIGLEDWEWGVTLWARNPEFLREIVYRMRFDEASAKYAEFGPFYTGYVAQAEEILDHCRVGKSA